MPYIIIFEMKEQKLRVKVDRPSDGFVFEDENEETTTIYNNEILFTNRTKAHDFDFYMNDDTISRITPGSFIVILKCNVKKVMIKKKNIWVQISKLLPMQVC